MNIRNLAIGMVTGILALGVAQGELLLVGEGESLAPVVVFEGAPPMTLQAAVELADYIKKISGVRPEVIEGRPDPLPEHAIWVGYQPVLEELFPGIDFDFGHPEEILIAANDRHLVVAGRDRWHEDYLNVEGFRHTIEGFQQEYGTANAVYTLLQDYLAVRWLMPGELGVDIIPRERIAFEPFEYRYHPPFRLRSTLFRLSDRGDNRGNSHEWTRFQRLQLDSMQMKTGSHFKDFWWSRFHDSHPEYFALQPDGARNGFPHPQGVKRCKSNPAVWEQWLDDVEADLEEEPFRQIFPSGVNESYDRGHCVCVNCIAWDNQQGGRHTYTWEGISQDYVALSDRHVTFYNKLAEGLRERFPDRDDLLVSGEAYGPYRSAPIEARPDENVVIVNVANFFLSDGEVREAHMKQFADWAKMAAKQTWRPNSGPSVGWHQGMPDVPLRQTMEDFRFVAGNGAVGLAFDTVWEAWATRAPLYYLMGQLAWDPFQDGEAILEDFYQRSYGPAAGEMAAYWALLEETRHHHRAAELGWRDLYLTYTPEVLERAREILDAAEERVADAPEKYGERLEFVGAGLEYTGLVVECTDLIRYVRGVDDAGDEVDPVEAADKIRANWGRIEAINEQYPLLFWWDVPYRMEPLHPDTYR